MTIVSVYLVDCPPATFHFYCRCIITLPDEEGRRRSAISSDETDHARQPMTNRTSNNEHYELVWELLTSFHNVFAGTLSKKFQI